MAPHALVAAAARAPHPAPVPPRGCTKNALCSRLPLARSSSSYCASRVQPPECSRAAVSSSSSSDEGPWWWSPGSGGILHRSWMVLVRSVLLLFITVLSTMAALHLRGRARFFVESRLLPPIASLLGAELGRQVELGRAASKLMSSVPASASRSALACRGGAVQADAEAHGIKPDESGRSSLNPSAREFVPGEEASSSISSSPRPTADSGQGAGVRANDGGVSAALRGAQNGKGAKLPGPARLDNNATSASTSRRGNQTTHWQGNQGTHWQRNRHDRFPARGQQRKTYRKQAYDKDLFLQANFRFLVSDYGDYVENTTDPDKMLDWEDIAVVEVSATSPVQCPICLDDRPLCPQITSCGHVFCFPCILRYMMIEDGVQRAEHWKKCPLCFTTTSCKDLRTVVIHDVKRYDVGDDIEFTLLTRAKGFTIPVRNNEKYWGSLAYSKDGRCDLFSKFTLTSSIEQTTDRAVAELTSWAEAAQFGGTEDLERLPYVFASIDQLKLRKVAWDEHRSLELVSTSPPLRTRVMAQAKVGTGGYVGTSSSQQKVEQAKVESEQVKSEELDNSTAKKKPVYRVNAYSDELERVDSEDEAYVDTGHQSAAAKPEDSNGKHQPAESDSYSFYQAADGQIIILHPVNMKCLLHHYGRYQSLPSSLRGRICEVENLTQTEATRKRYRYLSHLPLTSIVQLCEVDLSKVLPASALAPFSEELRTREKRRRRRIATEKQMKAAEERQAAASKPPSPADFMAIMDVLHDREVPTSVDFPEVLPIAAAQIAVSPPVDQRKLFSSVAKLGFAAGHDAPELGNSSSSSSSKPAAEARTFELEITTAQ